MIVSDKAIFEMWLVSQHFDLYRTRPNIKKACRVFEELRIPTLEGVTVASPGDYVIQGIHGEYYACKPDIFEKSYEKIQDREGRQPK